MAFWFRRKKRKDSQPEGGGLNINENDKETDTDIHNASDETEVSGEGIEEQPVEQVTSLSKQDRKRFVRETCEAIAESDRQIAEAKKEYEEVTVYLSDIQKIDLAEGETKKKLLEVCRDIVRLTEERRKYKNRNLTITEAQIRRFEPYEDDLVEEIRKMYNAEMYQKAIESDLENLNNEKQSIYKEQHEIVANQNALKKMSKVLMVLILSLFVLFLVIYYALDADMTFPYLGTVLLAAISATVLFTESNKNHRSMVRADRKLSKAISLLNRVKIKYVNNVSVIDYTHEKFGVKSAGDFENQWNEFCKLKDYERRFRENTYQLNSDNEELLELLKGLELVHSEIWLGRAIAIVDAREMVEVRHELNQSRQTLRERIEYNENTKRELVSQIDKVITDYPDGNDELIEVVKEYSMM